MPLLRWLRVGALISVSAALVILLFLILTLGGVVGWRTVTPLPEEKSTSVVSDTPVMVAPVPPPATETTTSSPSSSASGYLLVERNGVLTIYTENAPVRTLELDPTLLPSKMREELSRGISTDTWQEMLLLLQDFIE